MSDDYPIKYEAERLPPPIVADLNGDGKKEVVVATHDAKIQVKIYVYHQVTYFFSILVLYFSCLPCCPC